MNYFNTEVTMTKEAISSTLDLPVTAKPNPDRTGLWLVECGLCYETQARSTLLHPLYTHMLGCDHDVTVAKIIVTLSLCFTQLCYTIVGLGD